MEQKKENKILFAEDNEYDLELALRQLNSSGINFVSKCVENRSEFISEIQKFEPDIIICDYYLPDFNGLSAIRYVRENTPSIPVIITTGSINEETAVECMKAGASDYVLKDQLRRLPFSVNEILQKTSIQKARQQAEAALIASEAKFTSLINNISNIAVQGFCTDGTIKYWNKASEQLYYYSEKEVIGKSIFDLIVPQGLVDNMKKEFSQMIESGKIPPAEELELMRKDGSLVHVYSNKALYKLNGGDIEIYCIDIDLTDRKRAEKALNESETNYRNLVENAHIGIYQSTIEGKFLFVNDALARVLDYSSAEELLGVAVETIYFYPEERTDFLQTISEFNVVSDFETTFVSKYGHKKDVIISGYLKDEKIAGIILDITERKLVEKELLKAKEKAEESDKLKSSFLANLSHEVRTPMNGILGFAELLLEKSLDEESKRFYVETISQNSNQLLKIISDIIEISKIQTEQLSVNYREFAINDLLTNLENEYREIAGKKMLDLSFQETCTHENLVVISDESKIKHILSHLLDNAIKFTKEGGVILNCYNEGNTLEFEVIDSGIGINPDHAELIFEPFRQGDYELNRKYGGNGLGLSIARAYAELLDGKIRLSSNQHGGSTFTFSLPIKFKTTDIEFDVADLSDIPDYSKFTFLIAEDEHTNYAYIKKLLMPTGASLLKATTGKQVLEILEHNSNINLIFMDIKMPEIDGLEATRTLKKTRPELPVIATTAYAMTGDKDRCTAAGCDGYVAKPIRKTELFRIIKKVLSE
ncbi:MAG: hypothetical protein CVU14_02085 [Bacteroidetes bacterium HGW-Bacteroidetes-9]|nr:MAG: hypothetical protein CVU14_02085 [Bacteroidetes bacterium HGW-Bacteroidetes-9]